MAAKFKTGLKIIIVLLIVCCVVFGAYVHAANEINDYYAPAENDIFASSMEVKNVFSTDDANVIVIGTFLQGDDVMNDSSLFVKSYKEDGTINQISCIDIPKGYSVKSEKKLGNSIFVLLEDGDKKSNIAYLYVISSTGYLEREIDINVSSDSGDSLSFFAFWKDNAPCYAVVKNGVNLVIFDDSGNEILTYELSLDFELSGISYCSEKYFLCGAKTENTSNYGFVYAIDETGSTIFSIKAMENEASVCTEVFEKNENIYVLGKYFDGEAYSSVKYPGQDYEETKELIANTAKNSLVSQDYLYGEVLLSSSFESSPWSNYFFLNIDDSGEVLSTVAPFTVSESFGISELGIIDGSANANIAFGVAKIAETIYAETYSAQVYVVSETMETGKSADIEMPKNAVVYFSVTGEGKLICYTGLSYEDGIQVLGLKIFENTNEFAKAQKKLVICEKIISYIELLNENNLLFGLAIFFILYITARMSGKEEK